MFTKTCFRHSKHLPIYKRSQFQIWSYLIKIKFREEYLNIESSLFHLLLKINHTFKDKTDIRIFQNEIKIRKVNGSIIFFENSNVVLHINTVYNVSCHETLNLHCWKIKCQRNWIYVFLYELYKYYNITFDQKYLGIVS